MSRRTALAICAFWLLVGFGYLMSFYLDSIRFETGFEFSPRMALLFETVYVSWAGITFALYRFLRKPIVERRHLAVLVIFILGMAIWQPLAMLLDTGITMLLFDQPLSSLGSRMLRIRATTLFFHIILYIVVFTTCAVLIYQKRAEEVRDQALALERKNAAAELNLTNMRFRSLQSQLSPHFLFNSLNSISGLARGNERSEIITAVARLGDMLRFALETSERSFVSVKEEIAFTESYVSLQRLRFGPAYRFRLTRDSALDAVQCPPFVLQALVENAFTHEVSRATSRITIDATISRTKDLLVVSVENSANGHSAPPPPNAGLGLALDNLRDRLEILYGSAAAISCEKDDDRYIAWVSIPIAHDEVTS